MKIITHKIDDNVIAEITSDTVVINTAEEGVELLGDLYYSGFEKVILYSKNITPAFFDLKTKIAGEILQKFSNYRVQLCIVGDFTHYNSQSLNDFIYESNKGKMVNFLPNISKALSRLKEK